MTPAQLDHLARIKRHIETLLANAEKRTPGEWIRPRWLPDSIFLGSSSNAIYIASCAGNAEAGWKSTLAAIAHLQLISQSLYLAELPAGEEAQNNADHALKIILAAWSVEVEEV